MPTQTSAQKPAGASTQTFRGAVEMPEANGATSFLEVPAETVEALGAGKRPPVSVTLDGYTYRSTVAVYGGRYYLPVRKEVREGARITPGEPLDVSITLDSAPRTVDVPDDLTGRRPAAARLLRCALLLP